MVEPRRLWLLLPRQLRELPADLAATLALTGAAVLSVATPVIARSPVRAALVLPFFVFAPGYALVAALYPESGRPLTVDAAPTAAVGVDGVERLALSLASSVFVSGLLGVLLNFTPWGVRLAPVVAVVAGVTVLAALAAVRRRRSVPPGDRFRVPYRRWYANASSRLRTGDAPANAATVLLAAAVVVSVGAVGYAATRPGGERFTELSVLTKSGRGEFTLGDYPRNLTEGENASVVASVTNREGDRTRYTLVVQLQRLDRGNRTRVVERRRLRRFQFSLAPNETWRRGHELTPTITGSDLRVEYLLYRGSPPRTPTSANAYRTDHFWTNVTAPA